MPATQCVCRHSVTAHNVGSQKACSFCSCESFRDPADVPQPVAPLSEQALKALAILEKNPAFKHVPPEHLEEMARLGHRRLYLDGYLLMEQGEPSSSLHILVKGSCKVEREVPGREPIFLAELHPGDVVGEMGVLNNEPRSATVTALEDLETLELDAAALKNIFKQDPDVLIAMMQVVHERMKTTDELVDSALRVALAQLGED
jgi:CRP-like cAMP-binding protein